MNIRPESALRRWRLALCAAALALLAACGPGTGGTGTGPGQTTFGFAGSTAGLVATCSGASDCTVRLTVQAERVELVAGCRRFVRDGDWSLTLGGQMVLAGTVETRGAGGTQTTPGTLTLQFNASELTVATQVTATLRDASGAVLVGPSLLGTADAQSLPPAVCGGS